jgi:hypothetical protein
MDPGGELIQTQAGDVGIGKQKRKVDSVDQNLFAVAVGVLNAEDYIKIQILRRFPGIKPGLMEATHLVFPGKAPIHSGIAVDEVIRQHQTRIACLMVGPDKFLGGAAAAGTALAAMAVGFIFI